MIKFLKFTVVSAFVLVASASNGQDMHFSQFGMSNLTLNATTGVMTCNGRFSLVYRNQWASVVGRYAFNMVVKLNLMQGKMISMELGYLFGEM